MIEFNEKDFQMASIRRESKLFNLQTAHSFRFYGLKKAGNPLIHLSFNYDVVNDDFEENVSNLSSFFSKNGIEFSNDSGGGTDKVCIGLRRDLRNHTILCASILQTIVYCLEGRLDVKTDFKIAGIPKFPKY